MESPNRPFVVWAACLLWLMSILAILWSLLLFFFVGDMLFLTGTDLVNALLLLSGITMLPTNLYIMYSIAYGNTIDHKAKVVCCRLWLCIVWIILINIIGITLCIRRLYDCEDTTLNHISHSIIQYRKSPKHKHFIDNLQWSLGCCGLLSYKDWFSQDWHDKIHDYEWTPSYVRDSNTKERRETDNVPFSCCKSGSCVSNYLKELGTHSIHTDGCGMSMYRIIRISMYFHLIMFLAVVVLEMLLLKYLKRKNDILVDYKRIGKKYNIRHIMPVNNNFEVSSGSYNMHGGDSDIEAIRHHDGEDEN